MISSYKQQVSTRSYRTQTMFLLVTRFAHQYTGGAELSFQTLIDKCPGTSLLINSQALSENVLDFYKDKTWVFANIASVPLEFIKKISASNLSYYVSESDFKFCEHRLPQLCQVFNGGAECKCGEGERGHILAEFYNNSKLTFFRSEKQKQLHIEALELKRHKVSTLSRPFPLRNSLSLLLRLGRNMLTRKTKTGLFLLPLHGLRDLGILKSGARTTHMHIQKFMESRTAKCLSFWRSLTDCPSFLRDTIHVPD